MAGTVKLKDIAEALGISIVTVSNALSGKKGVSEAVRQKVVEKAQELGYHPAREIRDGQNGGTIGVLVSERYIHVGTSFYWTMYRQVVYAASRKKSFTMLEVIEAEQERSMTLPRLLMDDSICGLIVIGKVEKEYLKKLYAALEVPIVLLDFHCDELNCDAVMSNNYIGMYKATRCLLKLGHKDIGYIGEIRGNDNLCDRYFGFRRAMMEWGIAVRPEWVISNPGLVDGNINVMRLEKMPTAFVCCSDLVAGYLYDELAGAGIRVPEDISVVGYDNYLYGHPFAQELTTYNVDMKAMAQTAVHILFKKISGDRSYFGIRYLDSYVEQRNSIKRIGR